MRRAARAGGAGGRRTPDQLRVRNSRRWPAAEGGRPLDFHGACTAGTVAQTFDAKANGDYRVQFKMAGNPEHGLGVKHLAAKANDTTEFYDFDTHIHQIGGGGPYTPPQDTAWLVFSLVGASAGTRRGGVSWKSPHQPWTVRNPLPSGRGGFNL
ncbi:hypothetical protein ACQUSR_33320 [Streptomyces sp. P1-3]|uniref:hypothetical protein n=1 Tax=Streptomyces sp. P1-3 TaxID=3421658 RepID=UPI003D368111